MNMFMGYGDFRSPFLSLGSIWGSVFDGLDALSPCIRRSYIGGVGAEVLFSFL